ncbi:hypothetical protein [Burkholderia sp. HI2500]|uniref:hypothetical protein n=1 Tax=Burkholderia sp. HI2500 TaxID=2015358 RepID=UPI000B79D8F2|nr:hypothetical protein [Burkholderia sp. HI2500]OXJ10020.1 hypothetical protein CFB45_23870 [Burkholderia sp. HI2500]
MNFSSSLSSFVCIVSAGFVCAAGAQTLSSSPADTPSLASSTLPGLVPPQRSAQAAVARAAAAAAPALTRSAASAAVQPDPRAHSTLRRPLVPARPHRAQVASTPADDVWGSNTLYASPYAKSPYDAPAEPD